MFLYVSSRLAVFKHAYSREFLLDIARTKCLELNSAHAEELWDSKGSASEAYTITDPHYCTSPSAEAPQVAQEEAEEG